MNRRQVLQAGCSLATLAAATRFVTAEAAAPGGGTLDPAVATELDRFAERFMRDNHAPGMTLVLANREGVRRVVAYGLGDTEAKLPVAAEQLFQIGSISKSFVALCLLQLHDEGKLDLHRPILGYLPWFRLDSAFAPITTHHLLTHGSGLPSTGPVFLSDPAARHAAAYAPMEHFHYSNMAYDLLGLLASVLDGLELPEVLRKRVLEPLGMHGSEPVITLDARDRFVRSYAAFQSDRPQTSAGRLCEAPAIVLTEGAGCVASTAQDMGAYLRMIANRGALPKGRLISAASFELFSTAHIEAKQFGPTASYGYGVAVDTLDQNHVVRHTGGMVSFMSAMLVDIDAGVGAFASINAQQGYRPTPVVQFATQLLRAVEAKRPLPAAPKSEPTGVENAGDYAGVYKRPTSESVGVELTVVNEGRALFLMHEGKRVALTRSGDDIFIVAHADFSHFPLLFSRKQIAGGAKGVVTEAAWGSDWYVNAAYDGPTQFSAPATWRSYVGHYRNESPWLGSVRVVLRKDGLWMDGVVPLVAPSHDDKSDRFYLRDEPHNPEWLQFADPIDGRCMRLKYSGEDLRRVATS